MSALTDADAKQGGPTQIDWEHRYKTDGIVEIAAANHGVMDWIRHWEGRALRAEASLALLQSDEAVERQAEAMWQEESLRALGKRRMADWADETDYTKAKWRGLARASNAALLGDAP